MHRFFFRTRRRRSAGGIAPVLGLLLSSVLADMSMWASAADLDVGVHAGPQVVDRALATRAEAGDSWAQLNLGAALDHGLAGYPQDPEGAVFWYRRAADAGLAEAQFNLAHCLATGSGAVRDEREALGWMLKAAEQGLPSAQFLAGVMLAEGMGAPADPERALVWLRRAAAAGNRDAVLLLESVQGPSTDE